MTVAKAFYFFLFGALACLAPFLTLYYQDIGLTGRQIGMLTAIVPLASMAGSALWGMVADATGRHRLVFLLAIGSSWVSIFLMTRSSDYFFLILLVTMYALSFGTIVPLADSAVMARLGKERGGEYGRNRVWGSYGWGLAGALAGLVIAANGIGWALYSFLIVMVIVFLVATQMPMTVSRANTMFRSQLRQLLANRSWLLFLAAALIEGMSMGIFLNYTFLYLNTLNASPSIMGLTLTVATISEIPVFLYSSRLLGRWNAPFLLAVSLIFTCLRAFSFLAITEPWQALLVSLMHGPTFAVMWIAGVAYAARIAPPGLGSTAQGVFGGLAMGLGPALGAFTGGLLYEFLEPVSVFIFAGFSSLAAAIVYIFLNRRLFRKQIRQLQHPIT